jgi:hypothetical protein
LLMSYLPDRFLTNLVEIKTPPWFFPTGV